MKCFILGILALSINCLPLLAQTDGDFRTLTNGRWTTAATWQVRTAGSRATAVTTPTATSNVFLQAGQTVTLTGNESGNDFHVSGNSATTRIRFGANTLSVNGKLRARTDVPASVGTGDISISGTNKGALPGVADWIKSPAGGGLTIVGASRAVTTFGEWEATNYAAQPLPVSLLHFSGVPASGSLELRWTVTTGEEPGSSFSIQKAVAGGTFQNIGALRSSPENNGEYHFTDGEFGTGQQLYRLVLITASGAQHYSQTLSFEGKEQVQKVPQSGN